MTNAPLIVGVVGAGAMGRGIAQVAAAAGHRVLLSDADAGVVDRARDAIRTGLARDVAKGRIDQPRADALLARIQSVGAFKPEPRRWVVERTFAWLGRNRRLAKDFEASIQSAQAWVLIASIRLLSRRLARA